MRGVVLLATSITAGVLLSTPALAYDADVRKRLVDDPGNTSGCVVALEKVTRDYGTQSRYLNLKGWTNCRSDVSAKHVAGRAYGDGPRHEWLKQSLSERHGKDHFTLHVRCNNKMDGASWNHPKQPMTVRLIGVVKKDGKPYEADLEVKTPYRC